MKVFLDTNILLDLLLEREGYEPSAELFRLQEGGEVELCVSILTMVNVAYVYRKTVGSDAVIPNLKYLSALLNVLPMGSDSLQQALYLDGKDFEDIMQYVTAAQSGCDVIVTRNTQDFTITSGLKALPRCLPIFSPTDFLAHAGKGRMHP